MTTEKLVPDDELELIHEAEVDEDGGEVGTPAIAEKPKDCQCPKLIRDTAEAQGITCQRIFKRAYTRAGYEESVSRAIFARFSILRHHESLVPLVVKDYCERAMKMKGGYKPAREGSCIGCMLTDVGLVGVVHSYTRIHPEIDFEAIAQHATNPATMVAPEVIRGSSEIDKLMLDLVESGALDEGDDVNSLIRGEDDERTA